MKKILLLILFFVIALFGISFAVLNAGDVQLNYYFGQFQAPLSLVIVISLACGAVLGILASLTMIIQLKHEQTKLKKTISLTEKEVENLRSLPIKDKH
jgi:putative membrane protein